MEKKQVINAEAGEYVDVQHLLRTYFRYWYLFLLSLILCLGLAFVYLYLATPQYKVTSAILLKNEESQSNLRNTSEPGDISLFSTRSNIDNELEVLNSKSLMHRVFSELSLNVTYHVEEKFRTKEIYGIELPIRLSITKLHPTAYGHQFTIRRRTSTMYSITEEDGKSTNHTYGEEISTPYGLFAVIAAPLDSTLKLDSRTQKPIIVKFHDLSKIADKYNQRIKIEAVNRRASVIKITLIEAVPQKGKDIVNKLLEVYGNEALEDRNRLAKTTIQFIDDRLKYLTSELTDVEKDVEQFKRQNQVTDVTSDAGQYRQQASNYTQQLSELDNKIEVLESLEDYLKGQAGRFEVVPSSLSIEDPTLENLIAKFNDMQLEKERMLRTALPSNPLVQDLNDQLATIHLNILENLHTIKQGLAITRRNMESTSGRFRSQINKVPSIERELLEINRQQGTKSDLYLLEKREQAALSLEATVAKSRTLDPALVDEDPVSPKSTLIYLFAIIAGLGLPFTGIYVKNTLNNKIQTKRDVQRLTRTPILGEITKNTTGASLVITKESTSALAELFRLIRSNLYFATAGKENKVVLITSSMSGEGKTFFCINLGASLALMGKTVVILELDLRRPTMARQLGIKPGLGITNYLIGMDKYPIEDIIKQHKTVRNLFIALSGSIPPNPSELMTSKNLANLIRDLREKFDYVLIDTAPVGKVADAFSLNTVVDSTIYLMRFNYTTKSHVELIDDIYVNKKFPHPMIVFNDSKEVSGYGYKSHEIEKEQISLINL